MGIIYDNPNKTDWIRALITFLLLLLIACSCSSSGWCSGWCAILQVIGQHFQLVRMASLWHRMPVVAQRWWQNNLQDLCYNSEKVCVAKKLRHLPSIHADPRILPPGYYPGLGPGIRTYTGADARVWQPTLNAYNIVQAS